MAYTTIKKPSVYFNNKLWTGNGNSSHAQTGVGFQPDLVWLKARSESEYHFLFDAIRGATKGISSDLTAAEATYAEGLKSFDSDGFTIGTSNGMNRSGTTYASWNWKANGAGSANTDGSINSIATSANTTSGFSIVKYTGTASNATVGHGLGAVPKMIIVKNLISSGSGAENWYVYHASLGNNKDLLLNLTNDASNTVTTWNNTTPTSSVFSIGSGDGVNKNSEANIAYCFAEKQGYSKFGSYVGNGNADGTFVYTGFKPAFLIIKKTNAAKNWFLHDNKRLGYNPSNSYVNPNLNAAEYAGTDLDIVSNGFKMRSAGSGHNESGHTYIYMAFAEEPLIGDNPATAR